MTVNELVKVHRVACSARNVEMRRRGGEESQEINMEKGSVKERKENGRPGGPE